MVRKAAILLACLSVAYTGAKAYDFSLPPWETTWSGDDVEQQRTAGQKMIADLKSAVDANQTRRVARDCFTLQIKYSIKALSGSTHHDLLLML